MPQPPLEARFLENLAELGIGIAPAHLLVAVSGGCDSVALLHLLRFAARHLPLSLSVAHLDHAMRPDSAADARWVAGLCRAWGIPLVAERLGTAPRGEEAARRARYAFLRRAARRTGADLVLTAHHADDQAETVLFRALRGTGLRGLAGIPARTGEGVVRPLLPFWRRELRAYARAAGLRWRTDPTNRSLDPARNWIRRRLLPAVERRVAPGARRSLVSLGALAREAEEQWERVVAAAEGEAVREESGAFVLARARMRDYDSAIASRLLRRLLRRFGVVPGRTGTRTALQFITGAHSGREMRLPGGVRIRVGFEEARLDTAGDLPPDLPLEIPAPPPAAAERTLRIGGSEYRAALRIAPWGATPDPDAWSAALALDATRFPLVLRGRAPGDRMRTGGGTKSLKKLLAEERVPVWRREHLPVLVDAAGEVLWVAGVRRAAVALPHEGEDVLMLTIVNA